MLASFPSPWISVNIAPLQKISVKSKKECTLNNFQNCNYFLTNVHTCMYVCVYICVCIYTKRVGTTKMDYYMQYLYIATPYHLHVIFLPPPEKVWVPCLLLCQHNVKRSHLWWVIDVNICSYAVVVGGMSEGYIRCVHV